jgi:hypothetical protein
MLVISQRRQRSSVPRLGEPVDEPDSLTLDGYEPDGAHSLLSPLVVRDGKSLGPQFYGASRVVVPKISAVVLTSAYAPEVRVHEYVVVPAISGGGGYKGDVTPDITTSSAG